MMEFLFFAQRGIFERPLARGECAAMRAVDETVGVEDLKILANRNLRRFELAREFSDQNSALVGEQIEDGAAAFFVEHGNIACGELYGGRLCEARPALPYFFL